MPLGIELRKLGMFPASGCPDPADVYVRSDTLQRTRTASSALLDGIAPECRLGYRVSGEEKDPLFHALREGWCPITSAASAAAQVIASLPQGLLDFFMTIIPLYPVPQLLFVFDPVFFANSP